MTQTESPNDFLMGGGVPSFKFDEVGKTAKGPILSLDMQQQKDFSTGKPKFWDNTGEPMMQLRVVLQTDERDPSITDDDGQRALYLKGESQKAVRDAVREAGARSIDVGGTLTLKYTGDGEPAAKGLNPPKLFKAKYVAPAPSSVDADDLI